MPDLFQGSGLEVSALPAAVAKWVCSRSISPGERGEKVRGALNLAGFSVVGLGSN